MGFQGEHLIKELQQIAVCDLILGQELGFSCGRIHLFQWKAPYLHGTNHCKTVLRHSLLEFNNKAFKLQTIILISLYIYVYTHIYIYTCTSTCSAHQCLSQEENHVFVALNVLSTITSVHRGSSHHGLHRP